MSVRGAAGSWPALRAILGAWLTIDLFGKTRRAGEEGSGSLTPTVFTQGFLSWIFAALCFEESSPVGFAAATLSLVAGFATLALLGELADQLGRDADRSFLLSTPISARLLGFAHFVHATLLLSAFALGLAVPPAVLLAFKLGQPLAALSYLVAACVLSATLYAAIRVLIVALEWIAGSAIASAFSALLRALLFGGGTIGLLLGLRAVINGPAQFPGGIDFLQYMPPYWFARLVAVGPGAEFAGLAWLTPLAIAIAALLLSLLPKRPRRAPRRRAWIRPPRAWPQTTRAWTSFALAVLLRDRSFRLRALPLLGLPFAAVVVGLRADIGPDRMPFVLALVHQLPLAYLPFLLHFVPYAEGWRAAWLPAAASARPIGDSRRGVALAFAIFALPLQALLLLVDLSYRDGPVDAIAATLVALGLAWLLLPILAASLHSQAFSEDPEELAPPAELGGYAFLAIAVSLVAVGLEAVALGPRLVAAIGLAAAGLIRLRVYARPRDSAPEAASRSTRSARPGAPDKIASDGGQDA